MNDTVNDTVLLFSILHTILCNQLTKRTQKIKKHPRYVRGKNFGCPIETMRA